MSGSSPKDPDARYWAALAEGHLEMPRCARCGTWHWPAVARCGVCGAWDPVWHDVPATGTIFSWTRTWHPFGGTEAFEKPFVTVVVALDGAGGKRLMGVLENADADARVEIGDRVTGRIGSVTAGEHAILTIKWQPAA